MYDESIAVKRALSGAASGLVESSTLVVAPLCQIHPAYPGISPELAASGNARTPALQS